MRTVSVAVLVLVVSFAVFGQIPIGIFTFAGGGLPVNIQGTSASLRSPRPLAVDGAGNVFFADENHIVLRLDASTGVLTLIAGTGTAGFSGDGGPASSAQLNSPGGVAVDGSGNVYIADSGNSRIRKVSSGVITTVAGNGTCGFAGDAGTTIHFPGSSTITLSWKNTGMVTPIPGTNKFTISVTDKSGRCPVSYRNSNPDWSLGVQGTFTKRF